MKYLPTVTTREWILAILIGLFVVASNLSRQGFPETGVGLAVLPVAIVLGGLVYYLVFRTVYRLLRRSSSAVRSSVAKLSN